MKDNKSKRLGVRVTEEEYNAVVAYAERYGISISDALRIALTKLIKDENENED